jgi:tetratricopeptide (TPR) repeat protein
MFTSRNIHFAILGIILGATSGYILAFYQVQTTLPRPTANASPRTPQNHPEVTNEQITALFKQALEKNPNQPELMTRYANFLFDSGKYSEAADWFQKVLALQPNDLNVRTDMATALWNTGQRDRAMGEYRKALTADPKHMPTLHNLFVAELDGDHNTKAAADILKRMEEIDPKYSDLPTLKKRLAAEEGKK